MYIDRKAFPVLISVEVRVRLTDSAGNLAMVVRGNELRRGGKRVLIPFGGSMRAIAADFYLLDQNIIDPDLQSGDDLQFRIGDGVARQFAKDFVKRLGWDGARACREAKRELREEAWVAKKWLTKAEVGRIGCSLVKTITFENVSFRQATRVDQ